MPGLLTTFLTSTMLFVLLLCTSGRGRLANYLHFFVLKMSDLNFEHGPKANTLSTRPQYRYRKICFFLTKLHIRVSFRMDATVTYEWFEGIPFTYSFKWKWAWSLIFIFFFIKNWNCFGRAVTFYWHMDDGVNGNCQ